MPEHVTRCTPARTAPSLLWRGRGGDASAAVGSARGRAAIHFPEGEIPHSVSHGARSSFHSQPTRWTAGDQTWAAKRPCSQHWGVAWTVLGVRQPHACERRLAKGLRTLRYHARDVRTHCVFANEGLLMPAIVNGCLRVALGPPGNL